MNGPIATSILGLAYFGLYYMFAKRAEVVLIDKLDKQYPAERKKKAAAILQQDTDTVVCKNIRQKNLNQIQIFAIFSIFHTFLLVLNQVFSKVPAAIKGQLISKGLFGDIVWTKKKQ